MLDNSSLYAQVMHNWFINIACTGPVPSRRVNRLAPEIAGAFSGIVFLLQSGEDTGNSRVNSARSIPALRHGANFTHPYQGVSHAEWPKNNHEFAPP